MKKRKLQNDCVILKWNKLSSKKQQQKKKHRKKGNFCCCFHIFFIMKTKMKLINSLFCCFVYLSIILYEEK